MFNEEHTLPYELEGIPEDTAFGELLEFSESEIRGFEPYETFLDGGSDLYLGDGKNVYRVRKRALEDGSVVTTAEYVNMCDPDKYESIMENEDGFESVVGYVESNFAFYDEDDRFIPSPAESAEPEQELEFRSNAADKTVARALRE